MSNTQPRRFNGWIAAIGGLALISAIVVVLVLGRPGANEGVAVGSSPSPSQTAPTITPSAVPTIPVLPTGSAQVSSSPTPTESPEPSIPATATPAPSPTPISEELAQSNAFWLPYVAQFEARHMLNFDFASLEEVTSEADLIIRGHAVDLYVGEHRRLAPDEDPIALAYLAVAIDEVLKGEPVSRVEGQVEVQHGLGEGPSWDELQQVGVPPGENIWFLKFEPSYFEEWGKPEVETEIGPFAYFVPNHDQTVLRNIDGNVSVIAADLMALQYGEDIFPVPLDGADFGSVVDQVRTMAEGAHVE